MLGQRRLAQRNTLIQLSDRHLVFPQYAQDHQPVLIAQLFEKVRRIPAVGL